jgi:hypothetical protein
MTMGATVSVEDVTFEHADLDTMTREELVALVIQYRWETGQ